MASNIPETTKVTVTANKQAQRFQQLATKLRQWMSEESDYDQRVWPVVEQSLSDDGIAFRDPDAPHS